jgi:hypothetical protein
MRTKFLEFDNSLKQASLDGTLEAWLEQTLLRSSIYTQQKGT